MATYVEGQSIKVTVRFRDEEGVLVNPQEVNIVVRTPLGVWTTYTYGEAGSQVENTATGVFTRIINLVQDGRWQIRGEGVSGAWTPTVQGYVDVSPR